MFMAVTTGGETDVKLAVGSKHSQYKTSSKPKRSHRSQYTDCSNA